jgi:DNA-binding NtrC family response regulator
VKLLSALERRQITPLGADRPTPVDVRIVAATNLDRASLYSEQVFRADLLYRLNTIELEVPPLRDRGEDVIELAQHYVAAYARKYARPDKPLSDEAKAALRAERWRGNVRALRHAAERAVILSEGESYGPRDFGVEAPGPAAPAPTGTLNLVQSERSLVEQALQKHHYNISHAARDLGLTRAALYRRMAKHGL